MRCFLQVCKDNSNLRNHVLSHYYRIFDPLIPQVGYCLVRRIQFVCRPNLSPALSVRNRAETRSRWSGTLRSPTGNSLSSQKSPRPISSQEVSLSFPLLDFFWSVINSFILIRRHTPEKEREESRRRSRGRTERWKQCRRWEDRGDEWNRSPS